MDTKEPTLSASGAPIYTYDERDFSDFEIPTGTSAIEEISNHIEQHVGNIDQVFHEIISDQVHIDVHWIKATPTRPFHTFVTSGMSDLPMNTPDGLEEYAFAELSICLPQDWNVSEEDFKDENNYWPIRWLKYLARFPHKYNTWLGYGHTIPNGDPAKPFAENTALNTMVLLPTIVFEESFHQLELPEKTINFYSLIPLYEQEVKQKMNKGIESLFPGFDTYEVTDILTLNRPNTIRKKRFLGLF